MSYGPFSFEKSPVYDSMVAELSQEEIDSIQEIVNRNGSYFSIAAIKAVVLAEHPLCIEEDIQNAIIQCMANNNAHKSKSSEPTQYSATFSSPRLGDKPVPFQYEEQNKKWLTQETQRLQQYLDCVEGRKNWAECARYVGTRTSAQCKAKYNNMRATEMKELL